jgi:hypothetical protein
LRSSSAFAALPARLAQLLDEVDELDAEQDAA